jgi:nucleoside-diphosphate-sugar epimerase
MGDFLKMAERNKVFLFGNGNCRINPIAGKDLAEVCVKAIHNNDKEINIGGPKIFTYTEIAEVAFHVLNKPVRIKYIPVWAVKIILFLLQVLTSSRFYGPLEFMMTVLTMDMVAPEFGSRTLKHYFEESLSLPKTVAK